MAGDFGTVQYDAGYVNITVEQLSGSPIMKYYTHYQSPVGNLTLQCSETGLLGAWFDKQKTAPNELGVESKEHPILQQAVKEYEEYFNGSRLVFDVATDAQGTEFQKQVWAMLKTIPFGQTWSYQALALAINNPKAVRAVGMANGKNPLSIIVPCHRVIGKNGKLTGYAGGIDNKQFLLKHESEKLLKLT